MVGAGGLTPIKENYKNLMAFTANTLSRSLSGLREYRTVKNFLTTLPLTPPTQLFSKPIGPFTTKIGIRSSKKINYTKRTYRDADAPEEFTFTDSVTGRVYVMDKVLKQILRWDNPYTIIKKDKWLDWIEYYWNAWFPELRNQVFKTVWYSPDNNIIMYHMGKIDRERNGGF
jgi:hypothetical protein